MAASTQDDAKHLHGKYKTFFLVEHHAEVERWYNSPDTKSHQRRNFKELVKDILAFDVEAAKAKLRATDNPNVLEANAIFDNHNGRFLAPEAAKKAIQWLSFASPSQKQKFRDTFGWLKAPSMFCSRTQMAEDYSLTNKIVPSESRQAQPKKLQGVELLHQPSAPITAETLVIGRHPTHTGTHYVWKVGRRRDQNVIQRAHDATFSGAPWGDYGKEQSSNQTQWLSKTTEDFLRSAYEDCPERAFQNYNENYCTELYRGAKKAIKEPKLRQKVMESRLETIHTLEQAHLEATRGEVEVTRMLTTVSGLNGTNSVPRTLNASGKLSGSLLESAVAKLEEDTARARKSTTTPQAERLPPYLNPDGTLNQEFVDVAKRVRQVSFPMTHAPLKRRVGKEYMKKYHSRD